MENKLVYSYLHNNFEEDNLGMAPTNQCIEARDLHFNCINENAVGLEAKHSNCPETFKDWVNTCPKNIRRAQALGRYLDRRDELLYKGKGLDKYLQERR